MILVSPVEITENLFFAIFGQKDTDDFTMSLHSQLQPSWTLNFFKVSFSLYMLVSVIVLINLLIAMMSDTYQSIQSQSDIEWKYGLSKLIRNMQKTRTAPSPLNLVTTWLTSFIKYCKKRRELKKSNKMTVMTGFIGHRKSVLSRHSAVASQFSMSIMPSINNVVDWEVVRKKYRILYGEIIEKPSGNDSMIK